MKTVADVVSAIAAFCAAYLWFRSAVVKMPNPIAYFGYTPDHDPWLIAFRKSSTLSKFAAIFAGISALATGISTCISIIYPSN